MRVPTVTMERKNRLKRGPAFLPGTSVPYLKACHGKEGDPKARERLLACMMRKEGLTARQIASRLNRSPSAMGLERGAGRVQKKKKKKKKTARLARRYRSQRIIYPFILGVTGSFLSTVVGVDSHTMRVLAAHC